MLFITIDMKYVDFHQCAYAYVLHLGKPYACMQPRTNNNNRHFELCIGIKIDYQNQLGVHFGVCVWMRWAAAAATAMKIVSNAP